ncbi:MAG: uncharacterized protein KVP18_004657 [Porospora cf. gigantea A]|uniref:uncharacterized protein n=1 Tax=Porospora cf. gigantea A TaxID=2853593 RepID=UPI003559855D|nr:MAG: hypothetical protein KVP18_004657 [Porospora cf. gigantea A]
MWRAELTTSTTVFKTRYTVREAAVFHTAMCLIYEQSMKTANPHLTKVVYDLTDLRRFIDSLDDVLFFVQQDGPLFQARGRQWIKEAMYTTLKRESKPQGR